MTDAKAREAAKKFTKDLCTETECWDDCIESFLAGHAYAQRESAEEIERLRAQVLALITMTKDAVDRINNTCDALRDRA